MQCLNLSAGKAAQDRAGQECAVQSFASLMLCAMLCGDTSCMAEPMTATKLYTKGPTLGNQIVRFTMGSKYYF